MVIELIRKEFLDWDSDVTWSRRFKALGQRSDWEPSAIPNPIFQPMLVRTVWFNQGGLVPLCIDHVLVEMYNFGDLLCSGDLIDSKSSQFAKLFHKVRHLFPLSKPAFPSEDEFIVTTLLHENADEVVKLLSKDHWTSSCITTTSEVPRDQAE
ncbi:hypothetical protein M8C21_021653 [Ambrosia artemisiifolia]|uniref:Uncharacterized protein n=1 Tax=Ambrosia artemisiifolia TaxID=4212 RepID=A0AAD5BXA1_AMBAR|nr:hypothetical protein M8C21_021653 [Ambrosia artemisiifolia]